MCVPRGSFAKSCETLIPRLPHTRTFTLETFDSRNRTVVVRAALNRVSPATAIFVGSRS